MTDYASTYVLICEGPCNPSLAVLDEDVRRLASFLRWSDHVRDMEDSHYGRYQLGNEALWRAQQRLHYTPHHMVSPTRAVCQDCGYERQYGSSGSTL